MAIEPDDCLSRGLLIGSDNLMPLLEIELTG
jgi:hypothetical protein